MMVTTPVSVDGQTLHNFVFNIRTHVGRHCLAIFLSILVFLCAPGGLCADWETGAGYRRFKLEPMGTGTDGFSILDPAETGIYFTNSLSRERGLASQILP